MYVTSGKEIYPTFKMPLVLRNGVILPNSGEGYFGFLCMESGTVSIRTGTEITYATAPLILLIGRDHRIDSVASKDGQVTSLAFRPDAMNANIDPNPAGQPVTRDPDYFFFNPFTSIAAPGYTCATVKMGLFTQVSHLCRKIDENLNVSQGSYWPCMTRSYLLELLILLERSRYATDNDSAFRVNSADERTCEILDYLHTNYSKPLSLASLSGHFATNRTTLNDLFRKGCGLSVMAYLNKIRLDVAASLLRNTELPVTEIAWRAGFPDESYFSRSFRKRYGNPPAAYRKSFPDPYHCATS